MSDTYKQLGTEIGELVDRKSEAYGDSIGKSVEALKLLYPSGLRPDQYLDAILAARDFDKRSRIAQGNLGDDEDPRLDINGYALVALAMHRAEQMFIPSFDKWDHLGLFAQRNHRQQCALCSFDLARVQQPLDTSFWGVAVKVCSLRCRTYFDKWKEPAPCPNVAANAAHSPSTTAEGSASLHAPAPVTTAKTGSAKPASDSPLPSQPPSPDASSAMAVSAPTAMEDAKSPARENAEPLSLDHLVEGGNLRNMKGLCATCSEPLTPLMFTAGCHYKNRSAFMILNFCNHTCSGFFFVSMGKLL